MKTIKKYELKVNKTEIAESKISNSEDAYNYIRGFYGDDIHIYESSFILLLNRANTVVGYAKISQGGVAGTIIDFKIVLKYVIDSLASGFIMAHNHPSGNMTASVEDNKFTERLKHICSYLDCTFLDHIIVGDTTYYSYSDNGKL
jgi:DNA repair protein RadC